MKPVDCPFYYSDYYRGRETEECRLIGRNPQSRPWRRALCDSCPVPGIMRHTDCADLALEAEVGRRLFVLDQVQVTYAVCLKHKTELPDPLHCPECAPERENPRLSSSSPPSANVKGERGSGKG
jgi:hypothetical protein